MNVPFSPFSIGFGGAGTVLEWLESCDGAGSEEGCIESKVLVGELGPMQRSLLEVAVTVCVDSGDVGTCTDRGILAFEGGLCGTHCERLMGGSPLNMGAVFGTGCTDDGTISFVLELDPCLGTCVVALFFMGEFCTTGLLVCLIGDDGVLDDVLPESLGSEFKAAFTDASRELSDFCLVFPTSSLTPYNWGGFIFPSANARNASSFEPYRTNPILGVKHCL